MQEFERSFTARDNAGNEYKIDIYVDIHDAGTFDDPGAKIRGLKSLETEHGDAVKRIAKGQYELVETGIVLFSNDPDAP